MATTEKRLTTLTACAECRKRKAKCDGQRPRCGSCVKRDKRCTYTAGKDETQRQVEKRTGTENEKYKRLFDIAIEADDAVASTIFRRIRSRDAVEDIIESLQQPGSGSSLLIHFDQRLHQGLLRFLVQSTLPLGQLAEISKLVLSRSRRISLPPLEVYRPLRDLVISLETVGSVLDLPELRLPSQTVALGMQEEKLSSDNSMPNSHSDQPLYQLSASPWVHGMSNDGFSSLISVFLAFVNPYWFFVDADILILGMQSGALHSPYCSQVLVYAMLACASLFSQVDEAFCQPDDLLTRGQHFHDQALRLWNEEALDDSEYPALTSIQAALILAESAALRGKDKEGLRWVQKAAELNRRPQLSNIRSTDVGEVVRQVHARSFVASTVVWLDVSYNVGLLIPIGKTNINMSDLPPAHALMSSSRSASFRTFSGQPIATQDALMLRRREVTQFVYDLMALYSREDMEEVPYEILEDAQKLSKRMQKWHAALPAEMRLDGCRSPYAALFEMQAQYNCAGLMLCDRVYEPLAKILSNQPSYPTDAEESIAKQMPTDVREAKLLHCYEIEKCLRQYRERFGLKKTNCFHFQQAAQASFILLADMHSHPLQPTTNRTDASSTQTGVLSSSSNPVEDKCVVAFEECFRLILCNGLQNFLARGVAKSLYLLTQEFKSELPEVVQTMFDILNSSAWRTSDVRQFSSIYPNYAFSDKAFENAEYQMEHMVRRMEALVLDMNHADNP